MRKVSILSYNMTTADGANQDGLIPVGRLFDFIGDVETEEMILVDGDESLCLGYEDVKCHKDVFLGDMIDFKAALTNVGNTSRDCRVEVFKLATPAFREGKENCKEGDMIWFESPVLCLEGNVRLVVKKHLQRGEQPDGIVENPWRELSDFPCEDIKIKEEHMVKYRYRMSDRDIFYGGGVVNGARSITLANDAANRIMAKTFQNTGHCVEVKKVRLYEPCFAGDYMEFVARILKTDGKKTLIEVRTFKMIEVPENPLYPSSIDVLPTPKLSTVIQFVYEVY